MGRPGVTDGHELVAAAQLSPAKRSPRVAASPRQPQAVRFAEAHQSPLSPAHLEPTAFQGIAQLPPADPSADAAASIADTAAASDCSATGRDGFAAEGQAVLDPEGGAMGGWGEPQATEQQEQQWQPQQDRQQQWQVQEQQQTEQPAQQEYTREEVRKQELWGCCGSLWNVRTQINNAL